MKQQVYKTRLEWLIARFCGVGASELAGLLGLSRFSSPWSIWQEKVDKVIHEDPPSEDAEAGLYIEPIIPTWFHDKCRDDKLPDRYYIWDPGPWTMYWAESGIPMFATPDWFICDEKANNIALLEGKTAKFAQAKRFRKGFPLEYRCQVQAQMLCTGLNVAYYAVVLDATRLVWFREERNDKFLAAAVKKVKRFWQHVVDKAPPPDDFSEATARAIAAHYHDPEEKAIELPDEFATYPVRREAIKAKIKELEREDQGMTNGVKAAMRNATIGRLPDGVDFTWRPDSRGRRTLRTKRRDDG